MPNNKSAIKRMKTDAKKNILNQAILSELKTLRKKYASALKKKDSDAIKKSGQSLISKFDKAVKKGAIPKKRANRYKSGVQTSVNNALKS